MFHERHCAKCSLRMGSSGAWFLRLQGAIDRKKSLKLYKNNAIFYVSWNEVWAIHKTLSSTPTTLLSVKRLLNHWMCTGTESLCTTECITFSSIYVMSLLLLDQSNGFTVCQLSKANNCVSYMYHFYLNSFIQSIRLPDYTKICPLSCSTVSIQLLSKPPSSLPWTSAVVSSLISLVHASLQATVTE